MAYIVVPTKIETDPFLVTDWNTYVRDNFKASVPGAFTAKGDMMVASGAAAGSVLPVGANDMVLIPLASETLGVKWDYDGLRRPVTKIGDILAATGADAVARIDGTNDDCYLMAASGEATGLITRGYPKTGASAGAAASQTHGSLTIPFYSTELFDTCGLQTLSVDGGAVHQWDVAQTGYYLVLVYWFSSTLVSILSDYELHLYIDTTKYSTLAQYSFYNSSSTYIFFHGVDLVYLTAGQTLHVHTTYSAYGAGDGRLYLARVA